MTIRPGEMAGGFHQGASSLDIMHPGLEAFFLPFPLNLAQVSYPII
jgi:hypothetical protein